MRKKNEFGKRRKRNLIVNNIGWTKVVMDMCYKNYEIKKKYN
jgi:hypothetical protein